MVLPANGCIVGPAAVALVVVLEELFIEIFLSLLENSWLLEFSPYNSIGSGQLPREYCGMYLV
jgi:hypothetical protein